MKEPNPIENAVNPDLRGSWPALQRAAQRARQIAAQTGTAIVVMRNGQMEHLYPQPAHSINSVQETSPVYGKPV